MFYSKVKLDFWHTEGLYCIYSLAYSSFKIELDFNLGLLTNN
jgi:hypothetical protein